MAKKISIDKKEFLKGLSRIPKILGERPFFTFLGLLVVALAIAGIVFYKSVVLIKKANQQTPQKTLQFDRGAYEKLLEEWGGRERRFNAIESKTYPDPFRGLTP